MRTRRKAAEHASHERWLVSYADFITLLFAFFVVMFASSQVNKKKVGAIAAYFESYIRDGNAQVQVPRPEDAAPSPADPSLSALTAEELAPVQAQLAEALAAEIEQRQVDLAMHPRGLVLSLRESALFPPGRDTLQPQAAPILRQVGRALSNLPHQPVRLEGHTDNVPIATTQFPSNWELSAARAIAVMEVFAGQFAIDPRRLAVAGYADQRPAATNDAAEGRARNRRVDVVVLSRSAALMEPRQAADNTAPSAP